MGKFKNLVFGASRKANYVANVALVVMTVIVCANVIMRSVFRKPIEGTEEIVAVLAGVVISFSIAYAAVQKAHIVIDFLSFGFSKILSKAIDVSMTLLGFFTYLMASYFCLLSGTHQLMKGEVTQGLNIPVYPATYCVTFGCFALCIVLFVFIFECLKNKNTSDKEGRE